MDNEIDEGQNVGRRIALGLSERLRQFAMRRRAEPWWEFASEDPLHWKLYVLELVDDPTTTICFNLFGVDVWRGIARAPTPLQTPTDWELLQIYEHEVWWPRIEWWDEDERASNPFDRGDEP
jgi:hypothetical protein